jgi:hypothetical protein
MLWHFYPSPVGAPLCAGLRAPRRVSHTRENEDSATQGFKTRGLNFYSFPDSPLIFKTKPSITASDLNDVILGSSPVIENEHPQEEAENPEAGSVRTKY